jgi:hypothetical protein
MLQYASSPVQAYNTVKRVWNGANASNAPAPYADGTKCHSPPPADPKGRCEITMLAQPLILYGIDRIG